MRQNLLLPAYCSRLSLPEALETMMVGKVVLWRCKCGTRVKVLAEAYINQPPATQIAACPACGEPHTVQADKIISVTEDKPDVSPAFDSK